MMSRKRIEHQIALDLESIMGKYVGEPATPLNREQIKAAVESYLATMFHLKQLPVEFVSTTTPLDVLWGYIQFEFRDRLTGERIKTGPELLRLLGLP